jgi:hypothetical protein
MKKDIRLIYLEPCLIELHLLRTRFFYLGNMDNFRVVCINDKAMPKGFPASHWIKKGETYTVLDARYLARQHMSIGYKLSEIEIPQDCAYQYFLSNRFRPCSSEDEEAEEAVIELLRETDLVHYD